MMKNEYVTRLQELEANTERTPEEEAVRVALIELQTRVDRPASQAEIDAATLAVVEAEKAV